MAVLPLPLANAHPSASNNQLKNSAITSLGLLKILSGTRLSDKNERFCAICLLLISKRCILFFELILLKTPPSLIDF